MGKVDSKSCYIVHGWMRTELDLHGIELHLYALIYGFTQRGSRQMYNGSLSYLADWLGIDKRNLPRHLNALIEKGLLWKTTRVAANGSKECEYKAVIPESLDDEEMMIPSSNHPLGIIKTSPNNIDNKEVLKDKSFNTKTTKATRFVKPTIKEIEDYCLEHNITNVDPEYFFNYYEANGWVQGKNKPIKSWVACLNTWKRNNYGSGAVAPAAPTPAPRREIKIRINEYGEEEAYYDEP